MLIADDYEVSAKGESYDDLPNFKNDIVDDPRRSARKRKFLKELILGFLSFTLLTNNFIQCAVLVPVTPVSDKLTPEATIFYIAKDIALVIVSPLIAASIDHMGSDIPLFFGSVTMFVSTAMLACGKNPLLFLISRIFHGLASACIETSAFAIVANIFSTTVGRTKGFGVALEIASFGFYSEASASIGFLLSKLDRTLYLILAFIPFVNGVILCLTTARLKREETKEFQMAKPLPVPVWKLLVDPYVLVCAGASMVANIPLVFFQKALQLWATDDFISSQNAKTDTAWFLLFSHILGITLVILVASKHSSYRWLMTLAGLILGGLCCFATPFAESYEIVEISACGVAFGLGMVRAAVLPTLACVMEIRHVPVYGSVYAIANAFSSLGYIVAVLIAYLNLATVGFSTLIVTMGFVNILYAPMLFYLRRF